MEEALARGYSLWLVPGEVAGQRLSAVIEGLASRLGTPPFRPHLTLLPGIEGREAGAVLATARSLAAGLRPLTVRLASVEGLEQHFRCLFALVAADEPLRAAHAAAARAFGREPDAAFLPHLSLVYGTLDPDTKRALATEAAPVAGISFEAARLHVFRTEGTVAEWRETGVFPLGRGARP